MTTKHMIATGHTVDGQFVVESATSKMLADIAIADLRAANVRVCQELGIIPPDATTGLGQHLAAVEAAKGEQS